MKMLNNAMVSKGRMYYRQPSCLRWEYTTPYTYTFIFNHDKVLLKNARRNDVIDVNQNKLFREIAHIMLNSVVGKSLTDDKNFRSEISTVGGEWVATLLPQSREMKQMFSRIVLHISQKLAVVTQVELIEKRGDKTVIDLKNIKTNETLSADVFAVR
jgi:outer membrane lipoprotein carrier protein